VVFRGQYNQRLQSDNRITLPSEVRSELVRRSRHGDELLTPAVMVPRDESIRVYAAQDFREVMRALWATDVRWDDSVQRVLRVTRPHPAVPWFRSDDLSQRVIEAKRLLDAELKSFKGSATHRGRDAEQILVRALEHLGISVQSNVRVMGAEIDLLLLTADKTGCPSFCILEVKYGRRHVEISQVMRLFGLQEALRQYIDVGHAVLVTSAGLTRPAMQFTKTFSLSSVDFEGLLDWVVSQGLMGDRYLSPMFRMCHIDGRGRITVPRSLTSYFADERDLTVIGMLESFEIWGSRKIEDAMARSWEDEDSQALFERFGI